MGFISLSLFSIVQTKFKNYSIFCKPSETHFHSQKPKIKKNNFRIRKISLTRCKYMNVLLGKNGIELLIIYPGFWLKISSTRCIGYAYEAMCF